MPDQPLSDLELPNGIRYRRLEPLTKYALRYDDPDGGDELHVDLTFTAVRPPHYLGESHLDQPGRYEGTSCCRARRSPSTRSGSATGRGASARSSAQV